MREIRKIAGAIAVIAVALTVPAAAEAQNASDGWRFALTPYLWLPSISGTLKFKNPPGGAGSVNVDFDIGVDDYISDLNFALMLTGEARKDRWSLATDVIYVDLSGDSSSVRSVNFGGTFKGFGRVFPSINVNVSVTGHVNCVADFRSQRAVNISGGNSVLRTFA